DKDAPVDDERLRLQAAGLAAVPGPRDLELSDVVPIDLIEAGVAELIRSAAVGRPRAVRGVRRLAGSGDGNRTAECERQDDDRGDTLHGARRAYRSRVLPAPRRAA